MVHKCFKKKVATSHRLAVKKTLEKKRFVVNEHFRSPLVLWRTMHLNSEEGSLIRREKVHFEPG